MHACKDWSRRCRWSCQACVCSTWRDMQREAKMEGGEITEVFPGWRSSLLCQRSGRCWGSSGWRALLWTERPADPLLHLDHTVSAAICSAAAGAGWGHRERDQVWFTSRGTMRRAELQVYSFSCIALVLCCARFLYCFTLAKKKTPLNKAFQFKRIM